MSQRRLRNGGTNTRSLPTILKSRKRKHSENECEVLKTTLKENLEMQPTMVTIGSPLGDVTSTSLNVEKERNSSDLIPDDWFKFRGLTCYPTPQPKRCAPLPTLSWADKDQVWDLMCQKDRKYKKNPLFLDNHPALQPRMRSILLDWVAEVCEVYKLHRETYYLSVDYIDRYLSRSKTVPKQQLQLIGVTCLFIAAKIEEIYPPKLSEFSYVTDGACEDDEILSKELVILKLLNWDLTPVTSNSWLNTYMQLLVEIYQKNNYLIHSSTTHWKLTDFDYPHYSGLTFVQIARLLDLCTLDIESLNFTASELAAAALSYVAPKLACRVAGYSSLELKECIDWMNPFAFTLKDLGAAPLKTFSQVSADDLHNIQTHAVDLSNLECAQQIRLKKMTSLRQSPPLTQCVVEVLTPPKTDEKNRSISCEEDIDVM